MILLALLFILITSAVFSVTLDVQYNNTIYAGDCADIIARVYDNGTLIQYPECTICYDSDCYSMISYYEYAYDIICPTETTTFSIYCYDASYSGEITVLKRPSTVRIEMSPEKPSVKSWVTIYIYYQDLKGSDISGHCSVKIYKDDELEYQESIWTLTVNSVVYYIPNYGEYKIVAKCTSDSYEDAQATLTFYPEKLKYENFYIYYPSYIHTYEEDEIEVNYPGNCKLIIDNQEIKMKATYPNIKKATIGPYETEKTITGKVICTSDIYEDIERSFTINVIKSSLCTDLKQSYYFYYDELPKYIEFGVFLCHNYKSINVTCTGAKREGGSYKIYIDKKDSGIYYYAIQCFGKGVNNLVKTIMIEIKKVPTTLKIKISPNQKEYWSYQKVNIFLEYRDRRYTPLYDAQCFLNINDKKYRISPFESITYEIEPLNKITISAYCYKKNYEDGKIYKEISVKFPKLIINAKIPKEIKVDQDIILKPTIKDELGRAPKNIECQAYYEIYNYFGKLVDKSEINFKDKVNLKFNKAGKLYLSIRCYGKGYTEGYIKYESRVVIIGQKEVPIIIGLSILGIISLIAGLKIIKKIS